MGWATRLPGYLLNLYNKVSSVNTYWNISWFHTFFWIVLVQTDSQLMDNAMIIIPKASPLEIMVQSPCRHAISTQQKVFETPEGTRDPSKDPLSPGSPGTAAHVPLQWLSLQRRNAPASYAADVLRPSSGTSLMGEDGMMGAAKRSLGMWLHFCVFVFSCWCVQILQVLLCRVCWTSINLGHSHGKMWPVDVVIGNSHDTLFPNETLVAYH